MDAPTERLELVATVLLGVATAISAWCAYESALWNSRQIAEMARANQLQGASLRASEVVTRRAVIDATAFEQVLVAEAHGERQFAQYLAGLTRPQFRPALQAWLVKRSASDPGTTTPFDDEAYRESMGRETLDLQAQAQVAFTAAIVANHNSDLFVMRTVMIALALFFLGIATQMRARAARRLALTLGALVVVLTLLSLTRLERAGRPHPAASSDVGALGSGS
jgi:hypothetical protein